MRAGPIIAGTILLVLGLAAAIGGSVMKDAGDLCVQARCDDGDLVVIGIVGNGIFVGVESAASLEMKGGGFD